MTLVVDSNVLAVANRQAPQADDTCVLRCVERLAKIRDADRVALDAGGAIFKEYLRRGSLSGEPGVGDSFIKWVFDNQWNVQHCDQVEISPTQGGGYLEFPSDPRLREFDLSDRKFVAVSRAHPEKPPIVNAVDSDWRQFAAVLAEHGVNVIELC